MPADNPAKVIWFTWDWISTELIAIHTQL